MRLGAPRITPLRDDEMSDEQQQRAAKARQPDGKLLNIFRTLVRAPDAFRAFQWWGGYILNRNSLTPRDREILILRTGWLCKSGYEWTQHHRIGLQSGLNADEIEHIKTGANAPNWTPEERALLLTADDLHGDQFVSEDTWAQLHGHFNERQLMDVVFTVCQYTQVSMILNSFGIQLDEGQSLDPDLDQTK